MTTIDNASSWPGSSAVGLSPRGCPPSVGWNTLFPINFPFQKTWKPSNYITPILPLYILSPMSPSLSPKERYNK